MRGPRANQPRKRFNPNHAALDDLALKVPCPYCGASVDEGCWTLRSQRGFPVEVTTMYPHKQRIKAAWKKGFQDVINLADAADSPN